jgi:hypothetical protein
MSHNINIVTIIIINDRPFMQTEKPGEAIGLDVTSELIVSRSEYNPDDLMAARSCPGCGRQPTSLNAQYLARGASLEVALDRPFPDRIELKSTGMLSCECGHCGLLYQIFIFGPLNYGEMTLTGYFTIVENGFLDRIADELEALQRERKLPENIDDWAAGKLAGAIVKVFTLLDDRNWLIIGQWKEGEYRKKWVL